MVTEGRVDGSRDPSVVPRRYLECQPLSACYLASSDSASASDMLSLSGSLVCAAVITTAIETCAGLHSGTSETSQDVIALLWQRVQVLWA